MRRWLCSLSILVVVLLGFVVARPGTGTVAQEAADHPVIGAWLGDVDVNDPANPPTLLIFHDDGTFLQTDPNGGNGVGSWEATGDNNVALTAIFHGEDETGQFGGSVLLRASVEVDETGNTLTADYTLDFVQADGTSTGELGPGTASAERIEVEAMGTPTASMEMEDTGTPAAG